MVSRCQQATVCRAQWRARCDHPGSQALSSLNREGAVTMEIPLRARGMARPQASLNSERGDDSGGKSEAFVVAMNLGNVGGAKGCRLEIAGQGNMPRH